MLDRARELLRRIYGYGEFRGQQEAAIECALAGHDCVVLMPTGGGKSLCYQLPALVRGTTSVVVSPLIALMHDQVTALRELGVPAACLNSSQSQAEQAGVVRRLRAGELRLLYVAPERILQERTLTELDGVPLGLIAIDEAHCVSHWGHDFRQDYLELGRVGERFPGVPRMALTATADERTRADIALRLRLTAPHWFVGGFDRPNIRYQVRARGDARAQLLEFLTLQSGAAGIVYCMTRRKVDETATWLAAAGYTALPYHAGLESGQRHTHQERFLREDGIVMVATIAFGMGIDKPDVRFVAHLDLPKSIEAYYQETGRAGRDGAPAAAWMVYGLQDVVRLRQMQEGTGADAEHKRVERHKLDALLAWCEATSCRRQPLLEYFGEHLTEPCGNCDNCLDPPASWDATEDAQKLLSCIYRSGQRYGAAHVIDVLRGTDTDKVRRAGHQALSTFGIGAGASANHWRSVLRQLLVQGAVQVDVENFGTLKLGVAARGILRGECRVRMRQDVNEGRARRAPSPIASGAVPEQAVWERLRECRKRLASAQGVPPYVIFHDRTLVEMALHKPSTLADLLAVSGVGQAKLARYGAAFLAALHDHGPGVPVVCTQPLSG